MTSMTIRVDDQLKKSFDVLCVNSGSATVLPIEFGGD